MRTLRQMSYIGTALLTTIGFLAGCGGPGTTGDGGDASGSGASPGVGGTGVIPGVGGTGQPGAGGASGTGSSPSAGGAPGVGGGGGDVTTCVPGIPGTTQIPRLLNREYDAAVKEILGVTGVDADGGAAPSTLLIADNEGSMDNYAWNKYQEVGAKIAKEVMAGANKSKFIDCDPAAADCLKTTITKFGRKAFRHPLTADEQSSLEKLVTDLSAAGGTPAQVAETLLYAFLISPQFLLLPELAADVQEGGGIALNSHEVAVRLSIMLWGGVPDDILAKAADDGLLTTKEQILEQAQRMVAADQRERVSPLVKAFHRVYFDMDGPRWGEIKHDTELYPAWNDNVPAATIQEAEMFVEEVAFNGGQYKDLFLSNVGFVNNVTAPIYGLNPADFTAELKKVELKADERPGFLTRAAFLSSYSRFATTNIILRGSYITSRMMGIGFGPPTPGAADTPLPTEDSTGQAFTTFRAVVEELTKEGACHECHNTFVNPPGFVLEKYDSIGSYTLKDKAGGDIDGTATVTISQDGATKLISSPLELMQEIGLGANARRNYAVKWVSFATGRLQNANDACTVDVINTKLAGDGYTILNLLTDLTQADSFRLRTVAN